MARRSSTVIRPSVTNSCNRGRNASTFSGVPTITTATGRSGDSERIRSTCRCRDAP
jgi:hypothetical protein